MNSKMSTVVGLGLWDDKDTFAIFPGYIIVLNCIDWFRTDEHSLSFHHYTVAESPILCDIIILFVLLNK